MIAKTCQSLDGWCTKKQTENHNQSLNENVPNTNTAISKQHDSIDSPPAKISRTTKQSDLNLSLSPMMLVKY